MIPVFTLEARHGFFAGAHCPAVTFEPVAETRARLVTHGMVCRSAAGSLALFRPASSIVNSDLELTFRLHAAAPDFGLYTRLDGADGHTTLWFDTASAPPASSALADRRLHAGDHVSAADRVALDASALHDLITPKDHVVPPLGFVRVRLSAQTLSASLDHPTWFVTFETRTSIWRYLVLGAAEAAPTIVDVAGAIAFTPAEPIVLPDNRTGWALRSTVAIPFRERPAQHFQLRVASPGGDRVVIDRLPMASPKALRKDTVDGHEVWGCEVYVSF